MRSTQRIIKLSAASCPRPPQNILRSAYKTCRSPCSKDMLAGKLSVYPEHFTFICTQPRAFAENRPGRRSRTVRIVCKARIKVSRSLMGDFFATSYNFWKSSHYPGRAQCHARIKGSRSLRVCRSITSFFYSLIMYIMVPTESEERHGYS